jgi:L,D-peptidoglycan transpeptidase YkuD (ErfK/YbiS/YcfS/YnhG family)
LVNVQRDRNQAVRPGTFRILRVHAASGDRRRGRLLVGPFALPVALGRGGIKANKREGDGATPSGRFRPRQVWWRADRGVRPVGALPTRRIGRHDAWCEDPTDRRYNRPIRLAPGQAGDRLWRTDHLYDIVIELDHNTRPRVSGRGSAIFIHLARAGFAPTAGCIALGRRELTWLLGRLRTTTEIIVHS